MGGPINTYLQVQKPGRTAASKPEAEAEPIREGGLALGRCRVHVLLG